jgi:hypothetical protein
MFSQISGPNRSALPYAGVEYGLTDFHVLAMHRISSAWRSLWGPATRSEFANVSCAKCNRASREAEARSRTSFESVRSLV